MPQTTLDTVEAPVEFCLTCRSGRCVHLEGTPAHFTRRELSILRLLTDPNLCTAKNMAYVLGVTEPTLKVYMSRMYDKLRWKERSLRKLSLWVILHAEELGAPWPTAAQFGE